MKRQDSPVVRGSGVGARLHQQDHQRLMTVLGGQVQREEKPIFDVARVRIAALGAGLR